MLEELAKYQDKISDDSKCLYEYAYALYNNKKTEDAEKIAAKVLEANSDDEDFISASNKRDY